MKDKVGLNSKLVNLELDSKIKISTIDGKKSNIIFYLKNNFICLYIMSCAHVYFSFLKGVL